MPRGTGRKPGELTNDRRLAVFVLWRKYVTGEEIAKRLAAKFEKPTLRTIRNDIAFIKKKMVEQAQDLLGNQKEAVADFVNKSLETRAICMEIGGHKALSLAHQIDKDLLKIVGVNLDKIEVALMASDMDGGTREGTFAELMNEILETKAIPAVKADDL